MTAADAWHFPTTAPPPRGGGVSARTRYAPQDFVTLLWRERLPMLLVFAVLFSIGMAAAFTLKTTYTARAGLLISVGQEYAYEPRAGVTGAGALPRDDVVVQSEAAILETDELKERVIKRIGLAKLYPRMGAKYARGTAAQKAKLMTAAVEKVGADLVVGTAANTPKIELTFEHENPAMSARFLNALLDEYLVYRREILLRGDGSEIRIQRERFENELAGVDVAYEAFLNTFGIGDFESSRTTLGQTLAQLQLQRYQTQTQLRDAQGQLASLNGELARLPAETESYRDQSTAGEAKLTELQVELEQLKAIHLPNSATVRAKEAEVASMRKSVGSGATAGVSARRIGVNPIYQTVNADRINAAARVSALQQSLTALDTQVGEVTTQQIKIAGLQPQYETLTRRRAALQEQIKEFTLREQQDQAQRALSSQNSDNIKIVERPAPASKGKSMKKLVAAAALLFAGFTALCFGLVRMFMRPGMPTPSAAGRTLGLPVLGYAHARR